MANNPSKLPSLPKIKAVNACECGCGGRTGNRFVPGHDAKLGGLVKRVTLGVMTLDEVADFGGDNVAKATAKAMGLTWERTVEKTGTDN